MGDVLAGFKSFVVKFMTQMSRVSVMLYYMVVYTIHVI